MTERARIEQAILQEEEELERVVGMLEGRVELSVWPEKLQTALRVALSEPGMLRAEGWKAVALRRHLFGPTADVPAALGEHGTPSADDRKLAARLRSGLAALVRYRAGSYLLLMARLPGCSTTRSHGNAPDEHRREDRHASAGAAACNQARPARPR